jgi:beta-N-acetylhexosaminidase
MGPGACILGCKGARLGRDEAAFFAQAQPWGFILFARNIDNPDQLRALTGDLRDSVGRTAPILIDQEGGRVARMRAPHWRQWMAPLEQVARSGRGAARSMWLRYRLIADELHRCGIDVNCAPLGDLAGDQTHAVLKNRCYGSDPGQVGRIGRAVADGLLAGGVLPVLKHLPGQGRASADSHVDLPEVHALRAELEQRDFAPFRALCDLPLAMTAHVRYTDLDSRAATLSAPVISLIREDLGYDGLLMSDDISMQALGGDLSARARDARAAGCDLVLHCNGDLPEMRAIAAASGTMSARALIAAARALAARRAPDDADMAACADELERIVGGPVHV